MTGDATLHALSNKTVADLVREDIERTVLELAARRLEAVSAGDTYRKAYKAAAQMLREMKP